VRRVLVDATGGAGWAWAGWSDPAARERRLLVDMLKPVIVERTEVEQVKGS